ncbi:MAG TPA: RES family NAD+ phosphorylase [Candidatus Solibacter sp.]|nr:RES family NAD+ phosphorylase [Candidatus Solibacter sp.]
MMPKPVLPKGLPLNRARPGTRWMRIHARSRNGLWFGPGSGVAPVHRFDDPDGRFRVCYLGTAVEVCFAETFLRNPPIRILALDDLAERFIATIEVRRELRLVPIHGPGLAKLGATAELASGSGYAASRLWSRALWEHADRPDGILYRSRQDDSALCVALYDRAGDGLAVVQDTPLTADSQMLARLLRRYAVALTD